MENSAICSMPWCKGSFKYLGEERPEQCPKCRSFDNELSGGVTWTDKKYEGSRMDGLPHVIDIRVQRSDERKKNW